MKNNHAATAAAHRRQAEKRKEAKLATVRNRCIMVLSVISASGSVAAVAIDMPNQQACEVAMRQQNEAFHIDTSAHCIKRWDAAR